LLTNIYINMSSSLWRSYLCVVDEIIPWRMPEYSSQNIHYFLHSLKLNGFYNSHGVFSARYKINIQIYA